MKVNFLMKCLLISASLAGFGLAQAAVVVIVHPSVKANSVSKDEVGDIFLGKNSTLSSGEKVIALDQNTGSDVRLKFYDSVLGKSEAQLKAYWSRIIFTGKGQPPAEKGDSSAIKELVAKNPSLVGYIDSSQVDGSVKVVFTGS